MLTSRIPALETLSFHFVDLICDSVRQNNNELTFTTEATPLPNGESVALDIYYRRLSSASNRGMYFYQRSGNIRHNILYTSCEPSDSRYWFACFDEPWDKAEQGCQINITVPDSFFGCANGKLDSTVCIHLS